MMKSKLIVFIALVMTIPMISCEQKKTASDVKIIFLHHSTGLVIWNGKSDSKIGKFIRSKSNKLANMIGAKAQLPSLVKEYNKEYNTNYQINNMIFPDAPYAWANFPYDYYYLWVKNEGEEPSI